MSLSSNSFPSNNITAGFSTSTSQSHGFSLSEDGKEHECSKQLYPLIHQRQLVSASKMTRLLLGITLNCFIYSRVWVIMVPKIHKVLQVLEAHNATEVYKT